MKFSTREDIEAPVEAVWDAVTDFKSFERQALRRGADFDRTDGLREPAAGMGWSVRAPYRGRPRDVDVSIVTYDVPQCLVAGFNSGGVVGTMRAELLSLSKSRTRLLIELEMKPTSIPARVLMQTLRLAKSSLTHRFKTGVAAFAKRIQNSATVQRR